MKKFGCTSGRGRCYRVDDYEGIDNNCEVMNETCVIKNGLRRWDRVPKLNIKNPKQETVVRSDEKQYVNVSQVVAIGFTIYNGSKFYFFDERPIDGLQGCGQDCSDYDHVWLEGKDNCLTHVALIYNLIEKYGEDNVKVLLDYPNLNQTEILNVLNTAKVNTRIADFFFDEYRQTMFQNYNLSFTLMDITQTGSFSSEWFKLINPYLAIDKKAQSLSRYILGERVKKCLEIFMRVYRLHWSYKITEFEEHYISETNTLIKFFYQRTDQGVNFLKIFKVILTSTDYYNDINDIMYPLIYQNDSGIIDEDLYHFLIKLVMNPAQSPISPQLRNLEIEGNFDLIDKILDFGISTAENIFNGTEFLNVWDTWSRLYNLYQRRKQGELAGEFSGPVLIAFERIGIYPFTSALQVDGLLDVIYALSLLFDDQREVNIIHTYATHYPSFRDFFTEYLGVNILKYPEELPNVYKMPNCVSIDKSIIP